MLSMQAPHIPLQMAPGYEDQYLDIVDLDRRIYAGMVGCWYVIGYRNLGLAC